MFKGVTQKNRPIIRTLDIPSAASLSAIWSLTRQRRSARARHLPRVALLPSRSGCVEVLELIPPKPDSLKPVPRFHWLSRWAGRLAGDLVRADRA